MYLIYFHIFDTLHQKMYIATLLGSGKDVLCRAIRFATGPRNAFGAPDREQSALSNLFIV